MSSSHDDERLLDAMLADAREAPRPEELARVEDRLEDWLAPSGVPAAGARPRSLRSARVLRPLALAVIGAGLVTQVFLGRSSSHVDVASSPVAPPGAANEAPAPAVAPPTSVSVADLPEAPDGERPRAGSAAPSSSTARPRRVLAPSGVSTSVETKSRAADQESEASFLRRTRAALSGDPARALQMTEEHASRFPQGVLAQEREVIAIDALVRLGARDEARARASAFLTRYPRSAHAGRIAAILGAEAP